MKKKNKKKAELLAHWAEELDSKKLLIESKKLLKRQDKSYYRGKKS